MSAYAEAMPRLLAGEDLDPSLAEQLLGELMDGGFEADQIAAVLTALAAKGESPGELAGFARAMRSRAVQIQADEHAVDTCGTGGSGLPTVNTSTLVAFVLAAAGVPVAKHGNRASSGICGSSDVLEKAGVRIEVSPAECEGLLNEVGLAFLFAPLFHPAMKVVGPVRRSLGFRTVFNFLGPLCNPAGVRRQLLGVSSRNHAPLMAEALVTLGCTRAIVACGVDGLDELSLAGPTDLWIVEEGEVRQERVTPAEFGLESAEPREIAGGEPEENLRIFEGLLDGKPGRHTDHLVLNAAAGLRVAGVTESFIEGAEIAREVQASGRVREVFESYRAAVANGRPVGR